MLLEARQNRTKPSVVWSRAGMLVSWPSKTRAAKTQPFLIHCFGRRETSRAVSTAGMIAGSHRRRKNTDGKAGSTIGGGRPGGPRSKGAWGEPEGHRWRVVASR